MRTGIIFLIDCILLVCCLSRVPSLAVRPKLPFTLSHEKGLPLITALTDSAAGRELHPDDVITAWNGIPIHSSVDIEYRLDRSHVEDRVALSIERSGGLQGKQMSLVPAYTRRYLVFIVITGCMTWILAVFLLLQRSKNPSTIFAHWAMITLAIALMTAWEGGPPGNAISIAGNILFFAGYIGVAALFYVLVSFFPVPSPATSRPRFWLRLAPALIVFVVTTVLHQMSTFRDDIHTYHQFRLWFEIFHVIILLYIIASLAVLVRALRKAREPDERKKLQWILSGCVVGPMPFLLFTAVPDLIAPQWSIPEEYTLIPLGAVPVSFVIAIIRYQAFNIELLIRRSTAYALVVATVILAYVMLVGIIGGVFGYSPGITSAGAALVTALLFEPLRQVVHRLVDERFFRVQYNFRTAARKLLELLKTSPDLISLGTMILRETRLLVPTERIAVVAFSATPPCSVLVANEGFDEGLLSGSHELLTYQGIAGRPLGLDRFVEAGVRCTSVHESTMADMRVALFFPIHSSNSELLGCIAVSPKRSGSRFSAEDIDLFNSVVLQTGMAMDRIALQGKLLLEQAESRRLSQVSKLKSDFVSYVSHEFRTPLTSIKIFAELLGKQGEPLNERQQQSLHIIEGEADRLNRMVTNILNAAHIESKGKQYRFAVVDAATILRDVVQRFQYQLDKDGFIVDIVVPDNDVTIFADPDALGLAIGNLIDNGIKYSLERKELALRIKQCENSCIFEVEDFGRGIPADVQPHLFDMFYREAAHRNHIGGWGLGLSLVKHIVDAHGGAIDVVSEPGRGSRMNIAIPLYHPSA